MLIATVVLASIKGQSSGILREKKLLWMQEIQEIPALLSHTLNPNMVPSSQLLKIDYCFLRKDGHPGRLMIYETLILCDQGVVAPPSDYCFDGNGWNRQMF